MKTNRVRLLIVAGSAGLSALLAAGCSDSPKSDAGKVPPSTGAPVEKAGASSGSAAGKPSKRTGGARPAPDLTGFDAVSESRLVLDAEPGDQRAEDLMALMEKWVFQSPQDAAAWVRGLPAGDFRQDAAGALMEMWGAREPKAALDWLVRSGLNNAENLGNLAAGWAQHDPKAASEWALGLSDPDSRSGALASLAGVWAENEPAVAAAWVETLPANERDAPTAMIVQAWAESDPAAAAAWLGSLSQAGNLGPAPVATLVSLWTEKDAGEVSTWLNALPEGPTREAGISSFATSAAAAEPRHALLWAMTMKAPEDRNQTVADVCEIWYDNQPADFRGSIVEALTTMTDPAMRKGIYEMLYERDRTFHDNLLNLLEHQPPPEPAPAEEPEESTGGTEVRIG